MIKWRTDLLDGGDCILISIDLLKNVDTKEFKKTICFISADILQFYFSEGKLYLVVDDNIDEDALREKVMQYQKKFVCDQKEIESVFSLRNEREFFSFKDISNDVTIFFGDGVIGYNEPAIFLYQYFDDVFRKIALSYCATEKKYPVLLPMRSYQKTGYLKNSPQYSIFCSNPSEDMDTILGLNEKARSRDVYSVLSEPRYALSPSACFHVYEDISETETENAIFTFNQSVFRNEGRLNFEEFGRLMDYHVREIVFVGSTDFVLDMRENIMHEACTILEKYKFDSEVNIAHDPFIIPKMQLFKKIQIASRSKYEIELYYSKDQKMSVASFNLHGTAFTYPFNIRLKNNQETVSGCVGFGLERWVLAFLCQYGLRSEKWPEDIKNVYEIYKKRGIING